jgi:hypothetical protein
MVLLGRVVGGLRNMDNPKHIAFSPNIKTYIKYIPKSAYTYSLHK